MDPKASVTHYTTAPIPDYIEPEVLLQAQFQQTIQRRNQHNTVINKTVYLGSLTARS